MQDLMQQMVYPFDGKGSPNVTEVAGNEVFGWNEETQTVSQVGCSGFGVGVCCDEPDWLGREQILQLGGKGPLNRKAAVWLEGKS
jgi:hypothetical protein